MAGLPRLRAVITDLENGLNKLKRDRLSGKVKKGLFAAMDERGFLEAMLVRERQKYRIYRAVALGGSGVSAPRKPASVLRQILGSRYATIGVGPPGEGVGQRLSARRGCRCRRAGKSRRAFSEQRCHAAHVRASRQDKERSRRLVALSQRLEMVPKPDLSCDGAMYAGQRSEEIGG